MGKLCVLTVALASILALSGLALASPPEPKNFVAVLKGECPQADENWRGLAVFHLNDNGSIDYKVVVNNVEEAIIAGHIHFLPPGEPRGPIVEDLMTTGPAEHHGVIAEGTLTNPTLVAPGCSQERGAHGRPALEHARQPPCDSDVACAG
jgi:hypothetical protein